MTITTSGDVTIGAVSYSGSGVYSATITASKTAGNETITATDVTDGSIATTAILTETPGAGHQAPGAAAGRDRRPGQPDGQDRHARPRVTAGAPVSVTVNAVDANWNLVASATPTVAITSSDANATLPANAALVAGTRTVQRHAQDRRARAPSPRPMSPRVLTAGTSAAGHGQRRCRHQAPGAAAGRDRRPRAARRARPAAHAASPRVPR